ncbi:MAG: hypothetical protein IJT82_04560 [Schwartzia sp.]|nr:hypothetical protein [Schwartzia sp. (in: firmicutes)]
MNVNGTEVTIRDIDNISEQEILSYMDYIHKDNELDEIETLDISPADDGGVALDYTLRPPKFERIRRITGYLVGTIDRWNNAKRAEEHDRVKHSLMH